MTSDKKRLLLTWTVVVPLSLMVFAYVGFLSATKIKPFDVRSFLASNDPQLIAYEEYLKSFDDRRSITMMVSFDKSIAEDQSLYDINHFIDETLFLVPNIDDVNTLTKSQYLTERDGATRFERFFVNQRLSEEGLQALRAPPFDKVFLSDDYSTFLTHITASDVGIPEHEAIANTLLTTKSTIEHKYPGAQVHFLGYIMARHYYTQELVRNQTFVSPIVILLIALTFIVMLRSWRITLLCLYFIALSYAINMGIVILVEDGISPYSGFSLIFVLVIAIADLVHFFMKLGIAHGDTLDERLKYVRKKLFKPCLLTYITTMIGFCCLMISTSMPVRYLGIFCTVGSLICFMGTFYVMPVLVKIFLPNPPQVDPPKWMHVKRYPRWLLEHRVPILLFFFTLTALSIYPASQMKFDDNYYNKFVSDHPLTKAVKRFQEKFGYIAPIEVNLKPIGDYRRPEAAAALAQIQKQIESLPGVALVHSPASYMEYIVKHAKRLNQSECKGGFSGDNVCANIYSLFKTYHVLDDYVAKKTDNIRVEVYLSDHSFQSLEATHARIQAMMNQDGFQKVFAGTISGFGAIRTYLVKSLRSELAESFTMDYTLIFIVMIFVLGSVRLAFLAMIPNIIPLVLLAGLMGVYKLLVDDNIIILLNVVLGIIVDDTIHFMSALGDRLKKEKMEFTKALDITLEETSPGLIGMTVNFLFTIPAFVLMELVLFKQIAVFLCFTLAAGLLIDFFLVPLLVPIFYNVKDPSAVRFSAWQQLKDVGGFFKKLHPSHRTESEAELLDPE